MKGIIALIIVLLLALVWWLWPAGEITNYPSTGTDVIAFGDSLIQGVGATAGNDFVSQLSALTGASITNLGVSGDTTADGVARLEQLDDYDPKVVLVLLGGNDALQRVPISDTKENLETIIIDIQSRGGIVLLLGVRGGLLGDREFDAMYADLASEYGAHYEPDVLRGVFGRPALMADPIHPNDAGYTIIAERLAPVLESLQ